MRLRGNPSPAKGTLIHQMTDVQQASIVQSSDCLTITAGKLSPDNHWLRFGTDSGIKLNTSRDRPTPIVLTPCRSPEPLDDPVFHTCRVCATHHLGVGRGWCVAHTLQVWTGKP
jgi:hypothetical protein